MSFFRIKLHLPLATAVLVFCLGFSGCYPGGSARSRVFLGTVGGPVGGAVNVIQVTRQYKASPAEYAATLRMARAAGDALSSRSRKRMKAAGTSLISVPVAGSEKSGKKPKVMVYDTEQKKMASDQVFELNEEPKKDAFAEFSTYYSLYTKPKPSIADTNTGKDDDKGSEVRRREERQISSTDETDPSP
ncbi:MAG: hypothetical protein HKN23_03315 [Verrucomicrobiales bacterium]|nr:hypothetical protein [Verrucomicrobiales bacterium]